MSGIEGLEPLRIDGLEAMPSGRFQYSVRATGSGRELGTVRVCDDHRFEATTKTGSFVGVHRTLTEAMQALASLATEGTAQPPAAETPRAYPKSEPLGRIRPVRRGIYIGLTSRRRAAP